MNEASHEREEIRNLLLPKLEQLVDQILAATRDGGSVVALEEAIATAGDAVTAEGIATWLRSFDTDAKRVRIDGREFYRFDSVETTYHTSRGTVRLERGVYREARVHNGPTTVPLELRAGMIGGAWTPACAEAMAYLAQQQPEREAAETAAKSGAMKYSPSSFKRLLRVLGERWERDRDVFESEVVELSVVPEETASASIAMDRISLLVLEEDNQLRWRMAYVGAITMYDGKGKPLQTWRYGRMPGEGAHVLREQMQWDVTALQERRPTLQWVALSDGAHELCGILEEDYPTMPRLVDFWHVTEKLGTALRACFPKKDATRTLQKWKMRLLSEDGAIEKIERVIKRWNRTSVQAVKDALTYIDNHREQMRYASVRAQNLPIGSGHVESTCKQLVAMRMKKSGQRWSHDGGQAVLTIRSAALSGRWRPTMDVLLRVFRHEVEELHAA